MHTACTPSTCGSLVSGPGLQQPCPDASHLQNVPSHLEDWETTNHWTSDAHEPHSASSFRPISLSWCCVRPAAQGPRAQKERGSAPRPQPLPALCPHLMPMLTRWLILASHQTVIMGNEQHCHLCGSAPVTTPPSRAAGMGQKQRGREVWRRALTSPQVTSACPRGGHCSPGHPVIQASWPRAKVTAGIFTCPAELIHMSWHHHTAWHTTGLC